MMRYYTYLNVKYGYVNNHGLDTAAELDFLAELFSYYSFIIF